MARTGVTRSTVGLTRPNAVEAPQVNNTNAEGRLTLADTLVYACNQGVQKIVDLATLTGASIIALGSSIAGVFTPSADLAKELLIASEVMGEKLWWMPVEDRSRSFYPE